MNAVTMVKRCRLRQKALEDDPVEDGQAARGPISPGPFMDDHGEMPPFVSPNPEETPGGP